MNIESLIGKSFEHYSFDLIEKHKWSVTRINAGTKYVYVERENKGNKFGQWIPAEWLESLLAPKDYHKKIDALRKSRDYFKQERDDIQKRLVSISINKEAEERSLITELEFVKDELMGMEHDVRFWKVFAIAISVSVVVLASAIIAVRAIF
jgi:hypothetical protein